MIAMTFNQRRVIREMLSLSAVAFEEYIVKDSS